jgi:WD40 repeat protein
MRKIRSLATVLGVCLTFITVYVRADVVTQPLRKFGLGDLLQVAISPDRQWMATAGSGGAFLWDFEAGVVMHRLEAHHARVSSICFSPDGDVLLTGGYDSVIRAWNVATGSEIRSFIGHAGSLSDLTFAPDGQTFVSAGDNTARVWSLDTGNLLRTLTVPGASITRVLFAPNTNQLVTADGALTNNVRVWDLNTGQTLRSFGQFVQTLGFTAGGHLVTGGGDLAVQVWDIETGQVIRPLEGATQIVIGFVTSTNNSQVTGGCFNGHVITWNASTGDVVNQFFHENLLALAEIPGTNQILAGSTEKLVRVKNRYNGDNYRVFAGHTTSTTMGVGFSADGRYVVSGGTEALTRMWTRTNAVPHFVLPGHGAGTEAATFSPDGTKILTTFGAPVFSAQLWNASDRSGRTRLLRTHRLAADRCLFTRWSAHCHRRSGWNGPPLGCRHWRVASHLHYSRHLDSIRGGLIQRNVFRERRLGRNRPLVERHEWSTPAHLRIERRRGDEPDVFTRHRRIARRLGGWLSADV